MSTQVQIRRGNTAQTAIFTGAVAELTVDTDKEVVVVHDGVTAGGYPLARESALTSNQVFSQASFNTANGAFAAANSAGSYANSAFLIANSAAAYSNTVNNTQNTSITAAFTAANSAGSYANSAFATANNEAGVNLTQNTSITASFTAANSAGVYANGAFAAANTADNKATSAGVYANGAFATANNEAGVNLTQNNSITAAFIAANSAGVYANGAFARANNSLNANTGGTVTGDLTIGTGTGGVIAGANVIYSNVFVANSGGYVQFADGSRQFTANAGSGGGGTSNSFATISNTATALVANTSNTRLTIVGESGIVVAMNSSINQITIAAQPGAQGLTVDYGFVAEPVFYALDYGTL